MSLLNKAISSAGFGSARVETIIDTKKIYKGGQITGSISILGGKVEQKASKVSLVLMSYIDFAEGNWDSRKFIELSRFDIAKDILIKPNATIEIPFSLELHNDIPITFHANMIWLETSLDIKMAIDPSSKNYIQVVPHPFMQRILDVLQKELKFVLTNCENTYVPNNGCHLPIVQVFEFNALSNLIENINEMKIVFFVDDLRGLEIVLEFPKKILGSKDHNNRASSAEDRILRVLIPKKEFEKDDKSLADLLLHKIREV